MYRLKCFVLVLGLFLPSVAFGQDRVIIRAPLTRTAKLDIKSFTTFYDVPDGKRMRIGEVVKQDFRPLTERRNERKDGLGQPKSVTWLHFAVENKTVDTVSLVYNCNMHYSISIYEGEKLLKHYGLFGSSAGRTWPNLIIPPGQKRDYWIEITNYFQSVLPVVSDLYSPARRRVKRIPAIYALADLLFINTGLLFLHGCFCILPLLPQP